MPIKGLKLKRCPFCGNEISNVSIEAVDGYITTMTIRCSRCDTDFELHDTSTHFYANDEPKLSFVVSPIDRWNRRYYENQDTIPVGFINEIIDELHLKSADDDIAMYEENALFRLLATWKDEQAEVNND